MNTHYRRISVKDIEEGALDQINNILQLPFLKALAIMPDIHQGYGVPIGTVLTTSPDVVIPNAVGVDIGCGMAAVSLGFTSGDITRDILEHIVDEIRLAVPVGFNKRKHPVGEDQLPGLPSSTFLKQHIGNAAMSMGTLGGGNHFIELQLDQDDNLWAMVHSGSRNLGKQVCDQWNEVAKKVNRIGYSKVEPDWDLAFLHKDTAAFDAYLADMKYCVDFARRNRLYMMGQVIRIVTETLGHQNMTNSLGDIYDICHNHVAIENHMGKNLMVHRKGAAGPYGASTVGIIPGSQGTSSYLVTYKDTAPPTAMRTTSHGAGRAMGRKAAQRSLSLAEALESMKDIVHGIRGESDLDEAPGAYKDIDAVMDNQNDLCQIITKLRPLAVVKG